MAKVKKRVTKKNLKVVDETTPPSSEQQPTARQLLEGALTFAEAAVADFQRCVDLLNDAGAAGIFNSIEAKQRSEHLKALKNYVEKCNYAVPSLRDELRELLAQKPAPKDGSIEFQLPVVTVDVPHVPETVVLKANATHTDIVKAKECVGIGLNMLATAQIAAYESGRVLPVLEFFTGMHKDLVARVEASKGTAA